MPKTMLAEINESIAQFQETVSVKSAQWTTARTPQAFSGVEQEAHGAARKLADDIVAAVLHEILADVAFQAQCLAGAHSIRAYKSKGFKDTTVTLLGGNSYPIRTQYLLPQASKGRRARRRRGVGLWPCLVALGIWWHSSPALAGEVAHQIADSCSFRDGLEALKRRGIALGYKPTLALYQKFSQRAAEQRDAWGDKMVNAGSTGWADNGPLKGKTVLVSTDGGRCRERRAKRGRRLANGHHRYNTPNIDPLVETPNLKKTPCERPQTALEPCFHGRKRGPQEGPWTFYEGVNIGEFLVGKNIRLILQQLRKQQRSW